MHDGMYYAGFFIGHLHVSERQRILAAKLTIQEREMLARNKDPWAKFRGPLPVHFQRTNERQTVAQTKPGRQPAYLSQFDIDIYISYSPVDNLPPPGKREGWVDLFSSYLDYELSKRVGRLGAIKIWKASANHQDSEDSAKGRIERAAIFLVLTSFGYLSSDFCRGELKSFCEKARFDGYGLAVERHSRVFNLLLHDIPHSEWLQEISELGILGYPFYEKDDLGRSRDHPGRPSQPEEKIFQRQLRDLVEGVYETLQLLKDTSRRESPAVAEPVMEIPEPARELPELSVDSSESIGSAIFISYRRGESAAYAGRLYDQLAGHFGEQRVFMDIDTIEPGDDFGEVITRYVTSCSVLIVLINKGWIDVKDEEGRRRLDNPEDFVHLEISIALRRNIRVIPILIQGTSMPRFQDLPNPLAKLSRRNALELSDTRWRYDVGTLIKVLEKHLQ